jgi:hypothetical protein
MPDRNATIERRNSKAAWFAVGALAATLVFGLFLFAGDYVMAFASSDMATETPRLIIEGD